jgi:hypothetical protein
MPLGQDPPNHVRQSTLANESFRASHVRFGNFVGAVAQVPIRSDFPAPEAFLYDHETCNFGRWAVNWFTLWG